MNTPIAIEAVLPDNGIKTLSDKGLRITFDTNEPNEEQFSAIFRMKGNFGKLVFAPEEYTVKTEDIEVKGKNDTKPEKSPSQKLRAKMYRYYENNYTDMSKFQEWYEKTLETIGDNYLSKIEG